MYPLESFRKCKSFNDFYNNPQLSRLQAGFGIIQLPKRQQELQYCSNLLVQQFKKNQDFLNPFLIRVS